MNDAHPAKLDARKSAVRVIAPTGDPPVELPTDFFPIRLNLRSGSLTIACDRPDILVGRHSSCDIRLPLPDVSRRHCRLTFRDRNWAVTDLGSTNGIMINGNSVAFGCLKAGDRLKIGGFTFDVEFPQAGRSPTADDGVLRSIAATLSALEEVKSDLRRVI